MTKEVYVFEVQDLSYCYPGQDNGLKNVNCRIPEGKRTVILGQNGAGKSTLLWTLTGVLRPHQGRVLFEQKPLDYSKPGLTYLRSRVGLVMQNPDTQVFCPTVYQDVAYGPTNSGLPKHEIEDRVKWALQAVGASHLVERPVPFLSFGEKQKVALAGVLAMRPSVILLDEPASGLDAAGVESLFSELDRLRSQSVTLVMTTHDIDLAWSWADHFIIMDRGTTVWEGDFSELSQDPHLLFEFGLKPPVVSVVYERLLKIGFIPPSLPKPRHIQALISIIETELPSKKVREWIASRP
ncbi:MAG: energy-coupling factor ABC transporter ATP-binding protein [Syntrophothermus sp.]|uniref:energy-coupling factor ABC transporter ATP-binding protein n=1 Tax=Syntrophothermus sp. TaxID=2736299 RepID=UPI00257BC273|nr:energy-coupling factor ABC transporter ATP-binding protein [Syntrophothermus sp.]NSW82382.1 energy-coupling factor ABC transporter ATP-binding protein [Syntrophothermus sp.]